jgi:hypothetical protein
MEERKIDRRLGARRLDAGLGDRPNDELQEKYGNPISSSRQGGGCILAAALR